jgi:hypothetical protein
MTAMSITKRLTQPRRDLLEALVARGGSMRGAVLSVPNRRLASIMSFNQLVKWVRPINQTSKNLEEWTLEITVDGRSALNAN